MFGILLVLGLIGVYLLTGLFSLVMISIIWELAEKITKKSIKIPFADGKNYIEFTKY